MKEYFADKSASFFKSSQKFWKFYRSNGTIQGKSSSSSSNHIASILDSSNALLTDPSSIAKTFNNHFTSLKPSINISLEECSDFINNSFLSHKRLGNLKTSSFSFSKISNKEVLILFKSIDITSSAGVSGIPAAVIKHCAEELSPILASFYNYCLQVSCIPFEWKQAIVLPLFKKGEKNLCDNYRGISILSPFTKIFEKLLTTQITSHFNKNGLFSRVQHGFRANHSCETALQYLLDNWKALIDQSNFVISLFIEFKKAFDLLDSQLLFL
jgi:hypothetical protein